jgi:hypothetical protein
MSDERDCLPGEHSFDRSRITNEPVGRCFDCGRSVSQAEAHDEEASDLQDQMPSDEPEPVEPHPDGDVDTQAEIQGLIDWDVPVETFGLVTA